MAEPFLHLYMLPEIKDLIWFPLSIQLVLKSDAGIQGRCFTYSDSFSSAQGRNDCNENSGRNENSIMARLQGRGGGSGVADGSPDTGVATVASAAAPAEGAERARE